MNEEVFNLAYAIGIIMSHLDWHRNKGLTPAQVAELKVFLERAWSNKRISSDKYTKSLGDLH